MSPAYTGISLTAGWHFLLILGHSDSIVMGRTVVGVNRASHPPVMRVLADVKLRKLVIKLNSLTAIFCVSN